jgi:hypothetical protein
MPRFPGWLDQLCTGSLTVAVVCAAVILVDVLRHRPRMAIMAIVWPICALFGSLAVLWLYFRHGRETAHGESQRRKKAAEVHKSSRPFPVIVATGTLHCGSGCALGDIVAEWLAFTAPSITIALGWHSLFEDKTYAVWVLDFVVAFAFGIIFQYFAIVPMRKLSPAKGIVAALKADTLSLAAWQTGMYCAMALLQFQLFEKHFGGSASVNSVEFWGAMQLAMAAGFLTSYPMNWWLIRIGIKEAM